MQCIKFDKCYIYLVFYNDTSTTHNYTLSLHDALPISVPPTAVAQMVRHAQRRRPVSGRCVAQRPQRLVAVRGPAATRSEEHTSELQSRRDLVCRLLLEKKKRMLTVIRLLLTFVMRFDL